VPAPEIVIEYWRLAPNARLRDAVVAIGADHLLAR
jgi:hypothetical protein